jgi:hypothetical protein
MGKPSTRMPTDVQVTPTEVVHHQIPEHPLKHKDQNSEEVEIAGL